RDSLHRAGGHRLLFDNGDGGSGSRFDWRLIRDHPRLDQALVAGGIGPANARRAAALGAYAIDAGSALDAAPGLKSALAIRGLFEALRPESRTELRACA
ncbi:MAG: hypothetical protein H0U34_00815, partial [Sphingomonas sp.]|nr:hypothetical protein [Sphingomonas sp.]